MSTQTQERRSPARSGTRVRAVPQRNPMLAHLGLEALRAYRIELSEEERRVSYWRRLVQARLDVLATDAATLERLRAALTDGRADDRRTALLAVDPSEQPAPLPDLDVLWTAQPDPTDDEAMADVVARLADAERTLSTYRQALHRRLDAATADLIARYRENPAACLAVLPLSPGEGGPTTTAEGRA